MALKMRPTGLGHGVYEDVPDYSVFCGEWCIGRIYETRTGHADLHVLGVAVPFFFEGAMEGPYVPDGSAPRPIWTSSSPATRGYGWQGVHARTARFATLYRCARE